MKPMPCKYWRPHERGSCRNGETCPFLHAPPQDLPCKYYAAGHCRDGATCRFLHRSGEERKATACWEYSAGAGWRPFPASIVSKLEQAFQAGDRSVKYDIGGSCYELNLTDMKQCNLKGPGRRVRRVRRVVSGASTATPELGASTLALVKEADEAMDKCEEDITDVQDMLGKFDTSDYLAAQNRIRMLEDLLFKIAETLDCLSLVGPQRARR
eukprot:TRINITY_DN2716_c0_g1_i2.p1 TRINITY_DN2716_c0_g1~~TRINITY_DN2716_c0_g1_i2.p1  ORF type:complete len:212 (+),score=32.98 TRINITY_DN2716_c0_g1_i2:37-672(+)